jgi:hypothetical protein
VRTPISLRFPLTLFFFFFLALLPMASSPAGATTIRVPTDLPTITAAFLAASPGDTVLAEAGVHSPSSSGETYPLTFPFGDLHLLGEGAGISVLDAEGTHRVITWDVPGAGTIADLTITGGDFPTGAGIIVRQGDPEIRGNLIEGNRGSTRGAGIFIRGESEAWVHHNVVWQNVDSDTTDGTDPHGIVYSDSSRALTEHNVVGRTDGNGLLCDTISAPIVRHNIVVENGVPTPTRRGRGMCWFSSEAPRLYHNLFHANEIAALLWPDGGGDFDPEAANDFSAVDSIFGNVAGDPLFVDADGGDFHLQWGSPAIDAGDPNLPGDPDGTIADLGPFYFDQTAVAAPRPERSRPSGFRVTTGPNPFRHGVGIRFTPPTAGPWKVEVLDVSGRRVRRLAEGWSESSPVDVAWDGLDDLGGRVPSGIYFVRVVAAGAIEAAPVVRVR